MLEINLVGGWLVYACLVSLFLTGLLTGQCFNSPRVFQLTSIISIILALLIPIVLKFSSIIHTNNDHVIILSAAGSFLFALKMIDLAFGEEWANLQKLTIKQAAMDFMFYPRSAVAPKGELQLTNKDIRYENFLFLLQAFGQLILLRLTLYCTPSPWFSLPFSLIPPILLPFRYAVLGIILYLCISMITNIVFGLGGLIFNIPMYSTFPELPFFSTSIREFWSRRWNHYVKKLLHRISFVVFPKLIDRNENDKKTMYGLVAFLVSGLMHEFLFTVANDRLSGKNMIFFLIHAFLVTLEIKMNLAEKMKDFSTKILGWIWTMTLLLATSPLFFDPWIEAGYFIKLKQTSG